MEEIKKGKKLLITAIVVTLAVSLAATALGSITTYNAGKTNDAMNELLQGVFRFALEFLLLFFVYKGHKWARIVALVLFGLGSFFSFIAVIGKNTLMLVLALIYLFLFIALLSKPVKAYQKYKKTGAIE